MVNQLREVTDPGLLAQLNSNSQSSSPDTSKLREVTDPELLSQLNAQPTQNNKNSSFQDILNSVGQFFPKPQLPLGMNVASGLMSSVMPNNGPNGQSQVMSNLPQIAMGQTPGMAENIASGIGSSIPSLMTGGESKLGQAASGGIIGALQAQPGEALKSGLTNALTTLGLGTTLPYISKLVRPVDSNEIAKEIQSAHDQLSDKASQGFQNVSQGVNDRGITQVPINPNLIEDISNYFPKTKSSNALINNAKSGDYNSLRDLQSDLWTRATKASKSNLIADQNQAEEMFDKRDQINDYISNHLKNTGNDDLDNLLNQSRYDYANLKNTFYDKNLNSGIRKLVNPNTRKVPNNLMNILQENSKPMNDLRNTLYSGSFNPNQNAIVDLPSAINSLTARKNSMDVLKKLGWGGGALAGIGTAIHYLYPQKLIVNNNALQNQ